MTLGSRKKKCGFQCQGTGITSFYLNYNVYRYTLAGWQCYADVGSYRL
ncbi:hypothetical protein [Wolbachia endosymbiont (group B) of Limnophora tigrina]